MSLNLGIIASSRSGTVPTPTVVTSGMVLYLDAGNVLSYPGTGTTWFDLSLNNNNGTLINSPTYITANGGSILFNGNNQFVEIPSSNIPLNNVSQFSYSAWVKFNAKSPGNAFFSYGLVNSFNTDILFAWFQTNEIFFQVNNGSDGSGVATYTYSPFNTWINISVVYNGNLTGNSNRLKVYINGNEVSLVFTYTVQSTTASILNPLCRLGIYASDNTNEWGINGNIATTLLYNRALTSQEVLQNYDAFKLRY